METPFLWSLDGAGVVPGWKPDGDPVVPAWSHHGEKKRASAIPFARLLGKLGP